MIIYLHGFASVGNSAKSSALKAAFAGNRVIAPDLPADPRAVISLISDLVHAGPHDEKLVFVGTSLGGFYALYCAQYFDAPCIVVNPSTRPSETIGARLGTNRNHATGLDFEVTAGHIAAFAEMEQYIAQNSNGALINLILAHDDDVLDYRTALVNIPYRKRLLQFPDGGHRFEEHWDEVVRVTQDVFIA